MTEGAYIKEIVNELKKFQIDIPLHNDTRNHLKESLSDTINYLITNDFSRLISILYRLDISEQKLKQSLKSEAHSSAGDIIAEMIIERQLQKIKTRQSFKGDNTFSDEEKW